jgi:hypothetical protein
VLVPPPHLRLEGPAVRLLEARREVVLVPSVVAEFVRIGTRDVRYGGFLITLITMLQLTLIAIGSHRIERTVRVPRLRFRWRGWWWRGVKSQLRRPWRWMVVNCFWLPDRNYIYTILHAPHQQHHSLNEEEDHQRNLIKSNNNNYYDAIIGLLPPLSICYFLRDLYIHK